MKSNVSGTQDIDPSRTQEFIGGVPIVSTESRRVVLGEDGEGYIVTGEIVSSQTISSKTRTVETVTVKELQSPLIYLLRKMGKEHN